MLANMNIRVTGNN